MHITRQLLGRINIRHGLIEVGHPGIPPLPTPSELPMSTVTGSFWQQKQ